MQRTGIAGRCSGVTLSSVVICEHSVPVSDPTDQCLRQFEVKYLIALIDDVAEEAAAKLMISFSRTCWMNFICGLRRLSTTHCYASEYLDPRSHCSLASPNLETTQMSDVSM